jgi:hypothetical protein
MPLVDMLPEVRLKPLKALTWGAHLWYNEIEARKWRGSAMLPFIASFG